MKKKNTKEKIIEALEDKEKKVLCPYCNNDIFLRSAIEDDCRVYIYEDEDGTRDEDIDMAITEYTYKCAKCKKIIKELE